MAIRHTRPQTPYSPERRLDNPHKDSPHGVPLKPSRQPSWYPDEVKPKTQPKPSGPNGPSKPPRDPWSNPPIPSEPNKNPFGPKKNPWDSPYQPGRPEEHPDYRQPWQI